MTLVQGRPWDDGFLDVQQELERAGFRQGSGPFLETRWELRHPLAIPGPIYVAEDDACGCGPDLAPNNIVQGDNYDGEFVFRQPASLFEVGQIVEAAEVNPVNAYAMDGNRHWNANLVRQWWASIQPERKRLHDAFQRAHADVLRRLEGRETLPQVPWQAEFVHWRRWLRDMDGPAQVYLRRYCFFLANERIASPSDDLPDL